MRATRMLSAGALALAVGLSDAPAANAEIYRWTDASGRVHFTERLDLVPPEQRPDAVRRTLREPTRSVQTFSGPDADPGDEPATRSRRSRSNGTVSIPFEREGTLMRVDVRLNDVVTAPFLIDTGASGVSLPSHVADQLGIRVRRDTPHVRVMTAAGVVSRALVHLDSVEVGGARVEGLEATVNPDMSIGLLGGSFFNNFVYQVNATERVITLAPHDKMRGGHDELEWRNRFRNLLDPLAKLDAHLESDAVRRKGERNVLLRRRADLVAAIEELHEEANRLDVPQSWRQ